MMDEIRLWNVSLSGSQIKERFNRSLIGDDTIHANLVAYWTMELVMGRIISEPGPYKLNISLCGWNASSVICGARYNI